MTALTEGEYLATFAEPMRRLDIGESYKPVAIAGFTPPPTRDDLEIHHVYLNGDRSFYHVLIHYGRPDEFLAVVVDCGREAVHGHHVLDLRTQFGLGPG